MAATSYDIDYNNERFTQVETDKQEALNQIEQTYGGMINDSDQYYQAQINAAQNWSDKQTQLQQERTDFSIEQIEQQKDQAKQDYTKEQSGAYVDWQKQSNPYGANAEAMAAQGMTNTGYSESSQVGMYNTYQNRVATARESYNRAVLNYDNAVKDARLQNNAALAEIAYQALQTQLELSLQGFQYKNTLVLGLQDKKLEVENMYHGYWLDVLDQMNTENALAENQRQHDENLAFEREQFEWQKAKAAGSGGGYSGGGYSGGYANIEKGYEPDNSWQEAELRGNMAGQVANASGFGGTTRKEAVDYLVSHGVASAKAAGVLTKAEWNVRKGQPAYQYGTYTEYLKNYVAYAVENAKGK